MKRKKDKTPIKCKLCEQTLTASGMPSHLYSRHKGYSSDRYALEFGEFRKVKRKLEEKLSESQVICEVCDLRLISHQHLLYHIRKVHTIEWQVYFVKYFFKGEHPVCSCGCGSKVNLIRHGKNDKGENVFAREMLAGHNSHRPGYRSCTPDQKERMRKSAIKRMKRKKGVFFQSGPSLAETGLFEFIKENLPEDLVIRSDKELLSGLEVDILIPSLKIGVEYNGGYFHCDLFKDRKYHLNKTQEALDKGYRLIHIWEHDWTHNREIVKSILLNILSKTVKRVYARKTEIVTLTAKEANTFLNENHLQGASVSRVRFGLKYQGDLVSVMTFSGLRKAVGMDTRDNHYELVRFCNKKEHTVVGGASKLFKYFIKEYSPDRVISYASRDWSIGGLYENLEMVFKGYTSPGYFYVKSKIKYTRFNFQKHKLVEQGADPSKTEYEIMLEKGYYRVWDCGNLRYEWIE